MTHVHEKDSEETNVKGPWEVIVHEDSDSEDNPSGSGRSEEEDEGRIRELLQKQMMPAEYWHIQKLVKYIKTGNQTSTLVALCCLRDLDMFEDVNQIAIQDVGGLEVLVNILETRNVNVRLASLSLLVDLTTSVTIRRRFTDLGGVPILITTLGLPAMDVQILAAETLANVAKIRRARKIVRNCNGIPIIVDHLDVSERCLTRPFEKQDDDERELLRKAKGMARAVWSLSRSKKNKKALINSGFVAVLKKLLKSVNEEIILPIVGTVQECAHDPVYQMAFQTEGMIELIVRHLTRSKCEETLRYAAGAIFKCAESQISREQVRKVAGLEPLVVIMKDGEYQKNEYLLSAVTGAIWKCSITAANAIVFTNFGVIKTLIGLLEYDSGCVLTNVVGALSELVKHEDNAETIRRFGAIPHLINFLSYMWEPLLENVPMLLKELATQEDCMREIEKLDGVRLTWSLLKHKCPKIQENAAWALVPLVRNASDSGEMVRSFVGGLELTVKKLKSPHIEVVSAVCAALSEIACDRENLGVLSDYGLIPMLVKHINTTDDLLRENLAKIIGRSCSWGTNCKDLGKQGAITPLVTFLAEGVPKVQRTAAMALYFLSQNAFNCITMHESGIVKFLLKATGSKEPDMQNYAAGCLANIRKFALEAETFHLIHKGFSKGEDGDDEDEDDEYD